MILSVLAILMFSSDQPIDWIVPLQTTVHKNTWHGTGFLIKKDLLMTAAHVLDHADGGAVITAMCKNKKIKINVRNKFIDKARDLAIIPLTEECDNEIITLALQDPAYSQPIMAIGCPESLDYCGMITKGIVSLYRDEERLRMYSDLRIWYGNSGGPILAMNKELVGVLIQIRSFSKISKKPDDVVEQNYAVITPISVIRQFVAEYEILQEDK